MMYMPFTKESLDAMKRDNEELQNIVKRRALEGKGIIIDFETEMIVPRETFQNKLNTIRSLGRDKAKLQQDLLLLDKTDTVEIIKERNEEIKRLLTVVDDYKTANANFTERSNIHKDKYDTLLQSYNHAVKRNQQLSRDVKELTNKIASLNKTIEVAEILKGINKETIVKQGSELMERWESIQRLNIILDNTRKEADRRVQGITKDFKKEIEALEQSLESFKQENEKLKDVVKECDTRGEHIISLETDLQERNRLIINQNSELEKLKSVVKENNTRGTKIVSLEIELQESNIRAIKNDSRADELSKVATRLRGDIVVLKEELKHRAKMTNETIGELNLKFKNEKEETRKINLETIKGLQEVITKHGVTLKMRHNRIIELENKLKDADINYKFLLKSQDVIKRDLSREKDMHEQTVKGLDQIRCRYTDLKSEYDTLAVKYNGLKNNFQFQLDSGISGSVDSLTREINKIMNRNLIQRILNK